MATNDKKTVNEELQNVRNGTVLTSLKYKLD